MAKNVSITEDGNSKTIENVARIRTSLIGGGTCDWIPKDDVPLQTLTVTEDGTYRPEQNYYGFSQVTARGIGNVIEGKLIEKTITKNGTYNIKDESGSPYGYSKIIVNIDTSGDDSGEDSGGENAPVVGKDEDGNDTMAETDDDGNIVITALPTEIKVIIPPTKLEYSRYEEIDYSGISVYAYISKEIHWLGTTTTAVAEGSSDNTVSIGSSNVTASVGDGILYAPDRTGQNDVQLVWDGTKWIKPSNYSAEKAVWESDKYPTGKIPFEELAFPIKRMNENTESEYEPKESKRSNITVNVNGVSYIVTNSISYNSTFSHPELNPKKDPSLPYDTHMTKNISITMSSDTAKFVVFDDYTFLVAGENYDDDVNITARCDTAYYARVLDYEEGSPTYTIRPSLAKESKIYSLVTDKGLIPKSGSVIVHIDYDCVLYNWTYSRTDTYTDNALGNTIADIRCDLSNGSYKKNVKTVYYSYYILYPHHYTDEIDYRGENRKENYSSEIAGLLAWNMIYNYVEDDAVSQKPISLPVQWKRPGDGKILETTFTAWMKDDGERAPGPQGGSGNYDVPQ